MKAKIVNSDRLEIERQELLSRIEMLISAELRERINEVASIIPKPPQITITTSNSGAADAEPK